jgi:hypothetical protein
VCVCVRVALVIQHAKRMRCIILSPVACLPGHIFPYYHINGTTFEKRLKTKRVLDFLYNFEMFLILRGIQRDVVIHVRRSSCKVPVVLLRF